VLTARFQIAACADSAVERLRRALGVSGALAQVLVRRGLEDPAAADAFLRADERHSPSAFAGIEEAVRGILRHLRAGRRITVHGDYDVDGVCATAVLVRTLRALGASVDSYLPDRALDGYGLSSETVRRLAARGTSLLITVDCAITAVEEVELARSLGLDVVVTDHHAARPDGELPRAPIVHPALCGYPCPELCATAVAHKLAEALWAAAGDDGVAENPQEQTSQEPTSRDQSSSEQTSWAETLPERGRRLLEADLDLVALATIADVVPLVGENRRLARSGLRALAGTAKPGLRALMAVSGVDPAKLDERAVGFALAPRLNAAGRLYRADAGLELILTEDRARAGEIARELDAANRERRDIEQRIRWEAEAQISEQGPLPAYVLAGEGWHPGVIGIVASRLAERECAPVVMVALSGESGRGSGRSIEAFDLLAGLTACSEHLRRFGGHRAAAGLELDAARVGEFAAAFAEHAAAVLRPEDAAPVERVDAVLDGAELGMELAEELRSLAPFGRGNPTVSLMVADASFGDQRPMGEGKHVRFTVRSRGARARAVAFGTGGRLPVPDGEPAEATFTLEVNEWNGVSEPRLVLRRAQAVPCAAAEPGTPSEEPQARAEAQPRAGEEHLPAVEEALVLFALP
jgi:single-stranded-DNA-specific exonuclease